jgi:C1A family cysteine protease
MRRFSFLPVLFLATLLFTAPALALSSRSAPLAPEFLKSRGRARPEGVAGKTGYRPAPLDLSHLDGVRLFGDAVSRTATFPVSFDLRTLGRVTPVRDQQSTGTCWAHAPLGSIESNILTQGGGATSLSPKHLAWFVYTAPAHFTVSQQYFDDDVSQPFPPNRNVFEQGGSNWMAVAALARLIGPAGEADCPYGSFPYSPTELSAGELPTGNEPARRFLRHAHFLAGSAETTGQLFDLPAHAAFVDNVKTALQTYGALALSYGSLSRYMNKAHSAFYQPAGQGSASSNHAVTLVGWDDAYPKENMIVSGDDGAGYTPPSDGAWIFKNSWGTAAGESGYYRISYYSRVLKHGIAYVTDEAAAGEAVYDRDPLGWVNSHGYPGSDAAFFANVFTAGSPSAPLGTSRAGGTTRETLKAVSFYAGAAGSEYVIRVYKNGVVGAPTSGTLVAGPQSGTLDTPGYHTVALDMAPTLSAGERFAVVVRLRTPDYEFPIPVEYAIAGYSDAAPTRGTSPPTERRGRTRSRFTAER